MKKSDKGWTTLCGGRTVRKDHPRLAVCGDLDETCACVGAALAAMHGRSSAPVRGLLKGAQGALMFACGAAAKPGVLSRADRARLDEEMRILEMSMERIFARLEPRKGFIMPGATRAGACLHVARAVCRRAERAVVATRLGAELGAFLNRLSAALFLAARWADECGVRS